MKGIALFAITLGALSLGHAALAQTTPVAETPLAAKVATPGGTLVTLTSTHNDTVIYLARGDVPFGTLPDPFENVGVAPVTLQLAPGLYTVETTSPTESGGRAVFRVGDAPLTIGARTGDASVHAFGTVFIAMGIVAIVVGVIVVASYTQHEGSFNKAAIAIPLLAGGGALGLTGIGLTLIGTTRIDVPEGAVPPKTSQWIGGVVVHF